MKEAVHLRTVLLLMIKIEENRRHLLLIVTLLVAKRNYFNESNDDSPPARDRVFFCGVSSAVIATRRRLSNCGGARFVLTLYRSWVDLRGRFKGS